MNVQVPGLIKRKCNVYIIEQCICYINRVRDSVIACYGKDRFQKCRILLVKYGVRRQIDKCAVSDHGEFARTEIPFDP